MEKIYKNDLRNDFENNLLPAILIILYEINPNKRNERKVVKLRTRLLSDHYGDVEVLVITPLCWKRSDTHAEIITCDTFPVSFNEFSFWHDCSLFRNVRLAFISHEKAWASCCQAEHMDVVYSLFLQIIFSPSFKPLQILDGAHTVRLQVSRQQSVRGPEWKLQAR